MHTHSAAMAAHKDDPKWSKYGPMPPKPYTKAEVAKSDEMMAWAQKKYADDALALEFVTRPATYRYLVTYDWSVEKSKPKLAEAVEWRRSHVYSDATLSSAKSCPPTSPPVWTAKQCPVCKPGTLVKAPGGGLSEVTVGAGDAHCIAGPCVDRFGRPVIYFNLSRLKDTTTKAVIAHLAAVNEAVFDPASPEQMCFLMDARNFSLVGSGMGKELALEFITVFTQMYPERMGTLVLVEAPMVLDFLFSAIKPFMDPSTARKVMTVRTKDADGLIGYLLPNEPEAAAWLLHAMKSDPKKEPTLPPLPAGPAVRAMWRVRRGEAPSPASSPPSAAPPVGGGSGAAAVPTAAAAAGGTAASGSSQSASGAHGSRAHSASSASDVSTGAVTHSSSGHSSSSSTTSPKMPPVPVPAAAPAAAAAAVVTSPRSKEDGAAAAKGSHSASKSSGGGGFFSSLFGGGVHSHASSGAHTGPVHSLVPGYPPPASSASTSSAAAASSSSSSSAPAAAASSSAVSPPTKPGVAVRRTTSGGSGSDVSGSGSAVTSPAQAPFSAGTSAASAPVSPPQQQQHLSAASFTSFVHRFKHQANDSVAWTGSGGGSPGDVSPRSARSSSSASANNNSNGPSGGGTPEGGFSPWGISSSASGGTSNGVASPGRPSAANSSSNSNSSAGSSSGSAKHVISPTGPHHREAAHPPPQSSVGTSSAAAASSTSGGGGPVSPSKPGFLSRGSKH